MRQLIQNALVFTGEDLLDGYEVLIDHGRIAALLSPDDVPEDIGACIDLAGATLLPGFIDLQVNGGGDRLFNADPSVESIRIIGQAHRQFGTCGFLPTLISAAPEVMSRAIAAVGQAIREQVPGVLGIHLEGPFLNHRRSGIHDASQFKVLDHALIELVSSLPLGRTLVTLAPECSAPESIAELASRGVIVAAGHTDASYEQVVAAQDAGLVGFTHLFNAMSPLQSRAPGAVGAALSRDHGWFGIIADGYHVHPASLRIAVCAREPGAALLVTDAMPTVGGRHEQFQLAGQHIHLSEGKLTSDDGTLAGSHLDMLSAVNNIAAFAGIDWYEAVRMATLYPARALGLDAELGRIAPGYRANLVAVDARGEIAGSWIDGAWQVNALN